MYPPYITPHINRDLRSGALFGPLWGAATFVLLEEWLSGITIYWHFFFGALLILVVLFERGGIDGLLSKIGLSK